MSWITEKVVAERYGFPPGFLWYLQCEKKAKVARVWWHEQYAAERSECFDLWNTEDLDEILSCEAEAFFKWQANLQHEYKRSLRISLIVRLQRGLDAFFHTPGGSK